MNKNHKVSKNVSTYPSVDIVISVLMVPDHGKSSILKERWVGASCRALGHTDI